MVRFNVNKTLFYCQSFLSLALGGDLEVIEPMTFLLERPNFHLLAVQLSTKQIWQVKQSIIMSKNLSNQNEHALLILLSSRQKVN